MIWLRLYTEARNDAKLRILTDSEFRTWFNLLCLSSEQSDRGILQGFTEDLLAVEVCNADSALLRVTLEKLERLRIASVSEDYTITFLNFTSRQYDKPSDRPTEVRKRVQKHREKHENEQCNADVTPCNALDTDTDT